MSAASVRNHERAEPNTAAVDGTANTDPASSTTADQARRPCAQAQVVAAQGQVMDEKIITKACGYWYACGYNDHRDQQTEPYIDPDGFGDTWVLLQAVKEYRPSLQDAFKMTLDIVKGNL